MYAWIDTHVQSSASILERRYPSPIFMLLESCKAAEVLVCFVGGEARASGPSNYICNIDLDLVFMPNVIIQLDLSNPWSQP